MYVFLDQGRSYLKFICIRNGFQEQIKLQHCALLGIKIQKKKTFVSKNHAH